MVLLASCRKDPIQPEQQAPQQTPTPVNYNHTYQGSFVLYHSGSSTSGTTNKNHDLVYSSFEVDDSVHFYGYSFQIDSIGQTQFIIPSEYGGTILPIALLTFLPDQDSIYLHCRPQGSGSTTSYWYKIAASKTILPDPITNATHPYENQVEGQYVLNYTYQYTDISTTIDTTYIDTFNLNIEHSINEELISYGVMLDTNLYWIGDFLTEFSHTHSNFSFGYSSGKHLFLDNDSLYYSESSGSSQSGQSQLIKYTGHKL